MITDVSVVVPARDEQDEIRGCLESLAVACAELHRRTSVRSRVVVVLDDCRDATAVVAGGYPDVELRTAQERSVGAARRIGAADLPASPQHWLASTDADCRVPTSWLVRMLAHADDGADLVLGTVRPSAAGLPDTVRRAWFDAHRLGDGHEHVHAANLGIRASTYHAVGGWAPLRSHEDVDLTARVEKHPATQVRRCGDVVVETSSRTRGRAPNGFASYLGKLAAGVSRPHSG
ncbi:glycosyltransferase [uncultured Jatrophihabitans sp.]|uniref:glycosyltransferase n=1 Tax=uncultured Jatrophihabitans sp. TaxID=1610747 RepID=UPI0035CA594B